MIYFFYYFIIWLNKWPWSDAEDMNKSHYTKASEHRMQWMADPKSSIQVTRIKCEAER